MRSGEFTIFNPGSRETDDRDAESFYRDLNIDHLIEKMAFKWGRKIRNYYLNLPCSKEEMEYRRGVYADVKKEKVFNALIRYTESLEAVENLRKEKEKVTIPVQRAVWHIREVGEYCSALENLEHELDNADLTSEGMKDFLNVLKEALDNGGYRKLSENTAELLNEIKKLRFIITYDKDRMAVEIGEIEGNGAYDELIGNRNKKETTHLKNPFRTDPSISGLEYACLEILSKKKPEFFSRLKDIAEQNEEYENPVLKRFDREISFYLSFYSFQKEMEKEGFVFATPDTTGEKRIEAKGLYDLALALTSIGTDKKIVSNDLFYEKGEKFFVLTGPNQGGKTTFARSLGQLVYFTMMGLDVPAEYACVPYFPYIRTHFSVEESVETGRGKLMEELTRLAPMMTDEGSGAFVVINELFTTAANYDAVIMGKEVLRHFIGLNCMGIYVTHLMELTEGNEGVVSLRAMLDDRRIQTFRIMRGMADDTACAENQVNKYRLTYEQLKERL